MLCSSSSGFVGTLPSFQSRMWIHVMPARNTRSMTPDTSAGVVRAKRCSTASTLPCAGVGTESRRSNRSRSASSRSQSRTCAALASQYALNAASASRPTDTDRVTPGRSSPRCNAVYAASMPAWIADPISCGTPRGCAGCARASYWNHHARGHCSRAWDWDTDHGRAGARPWSALTSVMLVGLHGEAVAGGGDDAVIPELLPKHRFEVTRVPVQLPERLRTGMDFRQRNIVALLRVPAPDEVARAQESILVVPPLFVVVEDVVIGVVLRVRGGVARLTGLEIELAHPELAGLPIVEVGNVLPPADGRHVLRVQHGVQKFQETRAAPLFGSGLAARDVALNGTSLEGVGHFLPSLMTVVRKSSRPTKRLRRPPIHGLMFMCCNQSEGV